MKVRLSFALVIALVLPAAAGAQPLFHFHSTFWMNLHHYLHALGRANEPLVEELPASATDRERTQWGAAVDFYRSRYGKRSLLFDEMLLTIKQELIAVDGGETLTNAALTPEHRQVLERVAPIYRKHFWTAHNAGNTQYISRLQALLDRHGRGIAERLARSYDDSWPADGFRVDIVRDAGPPGNAYTTTVPRPTHITIGAEDLGVTSLESVFHEASHHWDQRLMKGVNDAAKQLRTMPPPNLWHAMLFYNAGRITADSLATTENRDYQMMMVVGKIFARPGWHEAIARHWPAMLAGEISRDEAILRIVRELTK